MATEMRVLNFTLYQKQLQLLELLHKLYELFNYLFTLNNRQSFFIPLVLS